MHRGIIINNKEEFKDYLRSMNEIDFEKHELAAGLNPVKKDGRVIRLLKLTLFPLFAKSRAHVQADRVAQSLLSNFSIAISRGYLDDAETFDTTLSFVEKVSKGRKPFEKVIEILRVNETKLVQSLVSQIRHEDEVARLNKEAARKIRVIEMPIGGDQPQPLPPPPPPVVKSAPPPPPPKGQPPKSINSAKIDAKKGGDSVAVHAQKPLQAGTHSLTELLKRGKSLKHVEIIQRPKPQSMQQILFSEAMLKRASGLGGNSAKVSENWN